MDSRMVSLHEAGSVKTEASVSYIGLIFPVILYFAATFGTLPLAFQVIISYTCHKHHYNDCDSSSVSAAASWIVLYTGLCTYGSSILMMGVYSSIADIYGRKYVIIASFIGLLIYCMILAYLSIDQTFFFPLLLSSSAILGLSGSYSAFLLGIFAYTSDATVSDPSRRRRAFSVIEACIYVAKIVGPAVTGVAASRFGFTWPLLACTLISLCGCCYVFLLPESLLSVCPTGINLKHWSPLSTFQNIHLIFSLTPRDTSQCNPLPYVLVAFIIYYTCLMGWVNILYVYVTHKFQWGPAQVGYYDSFLGLVQAFSMLCIPAIFVDCLGIRWKLLTWIQIGYFFR